MSHKNITKKSGLWKTERSLIRYNLDHTIQNLWALKRECGHNEISGLLH